MIGGDSRFGATSILNGWGGFGLQSTRESGNRKFTMVEQNFDGEDGVVMGMLMATVRGSITPPL